MRKSGVLSYLLADHLGSTTAVLDAEGNVVSSRTYWPYGAERSLAGDARATRILCAAASHPLSNRRT